MKYERQDNRLDADQEECLDCIENFERALKKNPKLARIIHPKDFERYVDDKIDQYNEDKGDAYVSICEDLALLSAHLQKSIELITW